MKEVYEYLKEAGTWFLAVAEGGQPHLHPLGNVFLYRDRLYFLTARQQTVSRELHANPRVELCALQGTQWLRVEGNTVLDDAQDARESLLPCADPYNPGGADMERWYLRNCIAALYTGAELVRTWRF